MRAMSFMRQAQELVPIHIELTLVPGLPQIVFIGLPDAAVRESALRIRSAIRKQSFKLPKAQRILVNLRPSHLRKSSGGLDLAVAAALLWETKQIPQPEAGMIPILYGELALDGTIEVPNDIDELEATSIGPAALYTGIPSIPLDFNSIQLTELKSLNAELPIRTPEKKLIPFTRPKPQIGAVSIQAGECAKVCAAGEHSLLLAGPAGSGKTTIADLIPALLREPVTATEVRCARKFAHSPAAAGLCWRPVAKPHHSITPVAMIGGGSRLWAGEIAKAHTGVLILDELLEFASGIQDFLREPVEMGEIQISRGGKNRTIPADFMFLATTNLCPCGRFVPRKAEDSCRCSRQARGRVFSRLSGPFADRFALIAYTDQWREQKKQITVQEMIEAVQSAIAFRVQMRQQPEPNGKTCVKVLNESLSDFQRRQILAALGGQSHRREQAVLRVARTIADLRLSLEIGNEDLNKALQFCFHGHQLLDQWRP